METFTAELSLAGRLEKAKFHPIAQPKNEAQKHFLREVFRLVLLLNATAKVAPHIVEELRVQKKVRKKGKRFRHQPPTLYYAAPTFGLKIESEDVNPQGRSRAGAPMPPHWRPGWEQRYYTGSKKGEQKVITLWRPPMFINSNNGEGES